VWSCRSRKCLSFLVFFSCCLLLLLLFIFASSKHSGIHWDWGLIVLCLSHERSFVGSNTISIRYRLAISCCCFLPFLHSYFFHRSVLKGFTNTNRDRISRPSSHCLDLSFSWCDT
jgi:hypothetical protein